MSHTDYDNWRAVEWRKWPYSIRYLEWGEHAGKYMLTEHGEHTRVLGYHTTLEVAKACLRYAQQKIVKFRAS